MTSSTRNILIGLALGVAMGLFLGEKARVFQLVAEAYLRLLQMTLLPYVMVPLIEGIGSLDGARARRLFVRVGTLSLVLWGMALGAVLLMPFVFPEIESASFFSTTLVENRPPLGMMLSQNQFSAFQYVFQHFSKCPDTLIYSGVNTWSR
jgi:Na+/H+-dicarboxylate symporter